VRATCPDATIRDGKKSLQHAINLHKLVGRHLGHDTLQAMAAAYAEMGQFSNAVGVQYMAIELLKASQLHALVRSADGRLKQYSGMQALRFDSFSDWHP
jgi:hypothetical protein